jgi:hypothetical protein
MDGRVKPGHDQIEKSVFVTVPALRSSVKNAPPRPGHGYHFSPNGRISSSKVQALRGCWYSCQ